MKKKTLDQIDFDKINALLEGFNKTTGFVTAILDLDGNILSRSGWRQICTDFHRVNPGTAKKCTASDTVLAGKMATGEKYHYYKCLNGLVDVAVPVIINGEHIANLFSGQFFFEEPSIEYFRKQAKEYGFNEDHYLEALGKVPVVSKEKVIKAMDFLLKMTQLISDISFQKLEQMELNEIITKNERILKLFVEHSPASIAMFDNNMRYLVTSRRFRIDYNLGEQDLSGKCHYDIFPELSEKWKGIYKRCLAGETISNSNDKFPGTDGKVDWVRWEIRPWYESENNIGGIILFSEVITEQVENHQALKESENYNRTLFEQSTIGLALASLDGRLVDINSTFARIIGRTVEATRALSYWEITPEKYKEKEQEQLDSLTKTGKYGPYEKEYIHKDGHLVPVRLQGLIIERNGEKFIWSSVEDISERRKAELELIAAKEKLSGILERISDGFGSLDRDWNYTYVNEKLAQNVGKKREELLGQNIWKVFPQAIGTQVHKAYLRAMEEQVAIDLEHFYPHFGRWFQHRFYPSHDGLSVFSRDITDSKLAEEKLKENSSLIRIAAEKAKLGGWNVILNENRSYWSDGVAAIHEMTHGYAPLVEDGINFYAPEWRDRITKVFTDCAQNGIPYDEEMEILTSSGKRVWVRTIGEAVRDENGKIFMVQGAFQDISEKKAAEARSREKDLQFRKLSANVPDLIFQFTRKPDGSYCVPVASEGIRNIFGCSPEDVLDDFSPIAKVIYPDDAERVIADIEYSAKNLTYFTCEFRVQIPGRPVQWIFSRSNPEKLPDGSITWYGFNADITQRKTYEDALRESEAKFRKIYEEGPFGMSLVNNDFKFIMANRTFFDLTGYTESDLQGLTFRDITYPEDRDIGVESIKKLIKGEIPVFRSEKRYVRKDRSVMWGSITVTANFDKNGNFLYNISILEDITGRKNAENQIKSLNERLELLVEAIQQLSVSASMDKIMTTVRTYARKLVNADGSTFILREGDMCYYADEDSVSHLWKGQRFPLQDCISGWAMINKQPVIIEDIYADERVPVEAYKSTYVKSLAIAPIRLNDPLGAIGIYWSKNYKLSDVEVKLMNSLADAAAIAVENVQLIEGLEIKIEERTSQLLAANEELEAFSYSVSHDLRAPLRHINGYVDMLNSRYYEILDEKGRHYLETISGASRKMGTLIDDLLQFSRTGRKELSRSRLDFNMLIKEVLKELEPVMEGRNIEWDIQDLPMVLGDYTLLKLVWSNLIDNAIKYTRNQEIARIRIGYKNEAKNFIFCIIDNGVGFDMKYAHKLYGVFQRIHSQTEFEGTGIGLANVQRIIHKHSGLVWAEAEKDKGASFFFSLPKIMEEKL